MNVRKIGGYVSVNKILGKVSNKDDVKIFVAGGETIDRKIEDANRKLLKQFEKEQAKAFPARANKREAKFEKLNPVQKFAVKILDNLKHKILGA